MLGHELPRLSNPPSLAGSLSTDPNNSYSGPSTPNSESSPRSADGWGREEKIPLGDPSSYGIVRKPARPKIKVDTQGNNGRPLGRGITLHDGVSTYDFASSEFPDSPIMGSEDEVIPTGMGVELPFDALMTLQHLSLEASPTRESGYFPENAMEMLETSSPILEDCGGGTPASQISDYSISQISIPSPGDFFASLGSNARHTWHVGSLPASALPPSSTTAEQFYKCPWNMKPPLPMGHVFELDGDCLGDMITPSSSRQSCSLERRRSRLGSLYPIEFHEEYGSPTVDQNEDDYEKAIEEAMEKNIGRTSDWLAAQTSYLAALRETNPVNDLSAKAEAELKRISSSCLRKASHSSSMRKVVRFLETETAKREYQNPEQSRPGDPIYYWAFQYIRSSWRRSDAFRHRLTRSDSIQSVRNCMPHEHVKRLKGEYHIDNPDRPNPPRPISLFPGKDRNDEDETDEQKVINRVERERQALEQVDARAWIIEATKYLSGNSLLSSPARWKTIRTPKLGDIQNGRVRNPARVLDLGGQPHGDWAWHCAREYPHAKVYTATPDRHLIDSRIRGPHNCRATHVKSLYHLPFPDHHFHAISARSLHAYLKLHAPPDPDDPEETPPMRGGGTGGGGGIGGPGRGSNGTDHNFQSDNNSDSGYDSGPGDPAGPGGTANGTGPGGGNGGHGGGGNRYDEYDACLAECLRVLKPGGYLEFSLLDAELLSPGPLGTKASVEFAYNLKTRGYDANPTRPFLSRLKKAGYDDIKRAWTFLPVGSPTKTEKMWSETPPPPRDASIPLPGDALPPDLEPRQTLPRLPPDKFGGAAQGAGRGPGGGNGGGGPGGGPGGGGFGAGGGTGKAPELRINTSLPLHPDPLPDPAPNINNNINTQPHSHSHAQHPHQHPTPSLPPDKPIPPNQPIQVEAVRGPLGSTDSVAAVSGLVGSWGWEQWMLRLQMEMGKDKLLEGVGAVLEEGKYTGAGWRCLRGWARKPLEMDGGEMFPGAERGGGGPGGGRGVGAHPGGPGGGRGVGGYPGGGPGGGARGGGRMRGLSSSTGSGGSGRGSDGSGYQDV